MILFLIHIFVFFTSAHADILFLDLNFAPEEVKAAKKYAEETKQKFIIYPQRSLEQQSDLTILVNKYQTQLNRYKECQRSGESEDCERLKKNLDEIFKSIQEITNQLHKIDLTELQKIFSFLHETNVQIDQLIISGHSSGTVFSGLLGRLDDQDISTANKIHPSVLSKTSAVLLWGCYSGTLYNLHNVWQIVFPQTKIFAGYSQRAPLGIRESSGILLYHLLSKIRELVNSSSKTETHQIFKSIPLVADLDATAIIGNHYITYDLAEDVDQMLHRCEVFDEKLLEQFECFDSGKPGCEMPPSNHIGPLRDLYSYLQINRHCREILKEKYPYIPTTDYLVRLIFLDNIKQNYNKHHKVDFPYYSYILKSTGITSDFELKHYVNSSRNEDVQRFIRWDQHPIELSFRDHSVIFNQNWDQAYKVEIVQNSIRELIRFSPYSKTSDQYPFCTPFAWVEENSDEKDSCGLDTALRNSETENYKDQRELSFFITRFTYQLENFPSLLWVRGNNLDELKKNYLLDLQSYKSLIELYSNRTNLEEQRLEMTKNRIKIAKDQSPKDIAKQIIYDYENYIHILDAEMEYAKERPNHIRALEYLQNMKQNKTAILEKIKALYK